MHRGYERSFEGSPRGHGQRPRRRGPPGAMMKKQPSKRVTKAWSSLPRQSMAGNKKALSRDAEHKMRALTRRVENYKRRETTLQREVAEAETLVKAERERGGDGNPVDLASEATQWMDALGKMRGAGREHPNFNSFRLMFGRAIVSRDGLEARMRFPARARRTHPR